MVFLFKAPHLVIVVAERTFEEFSSAYDTSQPSITVRALTRWLLSRFGKFKLNWDTIVDKVSKRIGIGIIIRNERGEALACSSSSCPFHSHLVIAETYALMRVVQLCQ